MTKEEKQQKREERIERAKDFAGHCVELAADTIITTALAIVVGKCISIRGGRMKAYILGIVLGIVILNVVYANIVIWESINKREA